MRSLKYLVLLGALAVPAAYAQTRVAIGVQIGAPVVAYGPYGPPPVCEFGYYPYAPYACAPYGYWGQEWFADGFFIGVGPWYHFYYRHPEFFVVRRGFGPGFHRFDGSRRFDRDFDRRFDRDRGFEGRSFARRDGFQRFNGHRADIGFRGGERFRGGTSFQRGSRFQGSSFHGNSGHGGRSRDGRSGRHRG
jgi:hypothetical protein